MTCVWQATGLPFIFFTGQKEVPWKEGVCFFIQCQNIVLSKWSKVCPHMCTYVFCMKIALHITSFLLLVDMQSPICMAVSDGNRTVFESGPYMFLFTINGPLLQQWGAPEDHQPLLGGMYDPSPLTAHCSDFDSGHSSLGVLWRSLSMSSPHPWMILQVCVWEEEGR